MVAGRSCGSLSGDANRRLHGEQRGRGEFREAGFPDRGRFTRTALLQAQRGEFTFPAPNHWRPYSIARWSQCLPGRHGGVSTWW